MIVWAAVAWAEPPGGGDDIPTSPVVGWLNDDVGPWAVVETPGEEVTLSLLAVLGNQRLGWSVVAAAPKLESERGERSHVEVALDVPSEAWLSEAAGDYVTDLQVRVWLGQREVPGPQVFLVWPDGKAVAPEVWTRETVNARAPQGVFREELRVAVPKEGEVRVMPMLVDTSPDQPSNVDDVELEVEP